MTKKPKSDETRVSVPDAAAMIGCSPVTIRRHIRRGNLRAIFSPAGRVFHVTRASFDAFRAKIDAMNGREG